MIRILFLHLAVGLGVRLRRVSENNELPLRQPRINLLHAVHLVLLRADRQRRQKSRHGLPAGIPQDKCSWGVVRVPEALEERIQVVRRCREVEPWRVVGEKRLDARVELGHSWDWGWGVDECLFEDADGVTGCCDFDCVVNV